MGIRGLSRLMESFGQRTIYPLIHQPDHDRVQTLTIDGPALAYHVYYHILGSRTGQKHPFSNAPTYQEISTTFVSYLLELERYGLNIHSIYFDGYLPHSKTLERSNRLQEHIDNVVALKNTISDRDLPHLAPSPSDKASVYGPSRPLPARNLAPVLCFVTAIIDALRDSKYRTITSVVPGEADNACAAAARQHRCLVLTSDSDLLVHDLGRNGRIAFLKDLEFKEEGGQRSLHTLLYHPTSIVTSLSLPDMITLAYSISQDPHRTLSEAVRVAKTITPAEEDFESFRMQYADIAQRTPLVDSLPLSAIQRVTCGLSKMETRMSELVHQLKLSAPETSKPNPGRSLPVYLPAITDDPTKSSAFQPSQDVRRLTYSLLATIDPAISNVTEYDRRGRNIMPVDVKMYSTAQTFAALEDVSRWLMIQLEAYDILTRPARWRAICVTIVRDFLRGEGKPPPGPGMTTSIVMNADWPKLTWALIHARAQAQATYYSLMVLKQVLDLLVALQPLLSLISEQDAVITAAVSTLDSLPQIADALDWRDCTVEMTEPAVAQAKQLLNESFGSREAGLDTSPRKKKRKKQKGASHSDRPTVQQKVDKLGGSRNVFSVLQETN